MVPERPMIRTVIEVAGRALAILRPADRESVADARTGRPVWPVPWPAGLALAEAILEGDPPPPTGAALELGCGLGVAGLAAALAGHDVAFTDREGAAVDLAVANAVANGVPAARVRGLTMDWATPIPERFPWILAADVLYERRLVPLVLDAIAALLAPGGEAWVADPGRTSAAGFAGAARDRGWRVRFHARERRDQRITILVLAPAPEARR